MISLHKYSANYFYLNYMFISLDENSYIRTTTPMNLR